jgi:hypothetical protein
MILVRGIERALDVTIERSQHTDARMQQWSAIFRCHDQRFSCRLPGRILLLGLRKLQDVIGGVLLA